jgi:hypothetical protein
VPREQRTGWWALDSEQGVWVEGPLRKDGFPWFVAALLVPHRDRFVIAELRLFPGVGFQNVKRSREGRVISREPAIGEWSGDPSFLTNMPTSGITKRLLGSVSFTRLLQEARDRVSQMVAVAGDSFIEERDLGLMHEVAKRPGRRRRPNSDYLVWAERYDAAMRAGSRSPILDLAKKYHRTPVAVRDLVHEARVRELLSRGQRAQAGGHLMPKALELRRRLDKQNRKRRRV